jgi:aspartate 1-decarboxylase
MQRIMLKSKIHRAALTGTNLDYEGSIAIDPILLKAADILPNEQVHVLNINNGSRITTYAIAAEQGSGTVMLNGPAARSGMVGDIVVVLTYANVDSDELADYSPKIVKVDTKNRLLSEPASP